MSLRCSYTFGKTLLTSHSVGQCRRSTRCIHGSSVYFAKKLHWSSSKMTHVDRALEHYDEFYGSVFKNRWPSLRLALLSAPKYVAVPNAYIDGVEDICVSLEELGAQDMSFIWADRSVKIQRDLEVLKLKQDFAAVQKLDQDLERLAHTRQAAEIDVLYQNSPKQKLLPEATVDSSDVASRVLKDIRDASHEVITNTRIKGGDDFLLESEYFAFYVDQLNREQRLEKETEYQYTKISNFSKLNFPPLIRPFCFEAGNTKMFPSAARHSGNGLREFICINGASLAPVIALDLRPDVTMLDMCSAPGTKSLLSFMTTCPALLTCNDSDRGRIHKTTLLMREFLGKEIPEVIQFCNYGGQHFPDSFKYSRILCDVPCLSDRVSCTIPDNNIFKPTRTRERLSLVSIQKNILSHALKILSPEYGASLVYSTCTLSPVENDGVVGAALRESLDDGLHVDLLGLWTALKPFQDAGLFYISRTKFGVLIEPNIVSNFGPMYVCRITYIPPADSASIHQENVEAEQ